MKSDQREYQETEESLVMLASQGDPDAFNQLIQKYHTSNNKNEIKPH